MKTKLTPKEIDLMQEVKSEWIDRFNSLEFDEKKAKDLMDELYTMAGYEKPIKVILDSPLALQYACNMLQKGFKLSQVKSQVE